VFHRALALVFGGALAVTPFVFMLASASHSDERVIVREVQVVQTRVVVVSTVQVVVVTATPQPPTQTPTVTPPTVTPQPAADSGVDQSQAVGTPPARVYAGIPTLAPQKLVNRAGRSVGPKDEDQSVPVWICGSPTPVGFPFGPVHC
jgi:hypothetical protein